MHVHLPYLLESYSTFSTQRFFTPFKFDDLSPNDNSASEALEKVTLLLGGSIPSTFDNASILIDGEPLSYRGLVSGFVKKDNECTFCGVISFERYYIPYSIYKGRFSYVIKNTDLFSSYNVSLLDIIPWEIKCWYHTLGFDTPRPFSEFVSKMFSRKSSLFSNVKIHPSSVREYPSIIEISDLLVPANTTIRITMEADKRFLRYTEFPLDAHRGLEIGFGYFN
ncbi:hypothetical protein DI09_18p210 [Mitosporidium daphniae]|uniref:Uncharacterized protein n=1 Tax=Mitosporidium daphniae TaxID=1485682 RepID=A0A098VTP1_9MICR|nr:uncharacterized protein DI09_18p210 [Mitosporidium daphniae]KGG52315.1 hypothetical protein DI09_18p210 [Mitosporidium daphniae]|eukprot:XP_013238742.1 uncharacterized protein DI09_18p210 [Mitosporidium daphniae]